MAKYLILISMFLFGCEVSSKQIIKPEKLYFSEIKFDAVSKKLICENDSNDLDINNMKEIISYWFDNKILVDGFEGSVVFFIKNIDIEKVKREDFFNFSIELVFEIKVSNNDLTKSKTHIVKVSEFGEIVGYFSLKDQENLTLNAMHQSLNSVSSKLRELN